jgi:predicted nucleic acid-binding protein
LILYVDTSAFLKLYLQEMGSDLVRESVDRATAVFTHLITYAEMQASLTRAVQQRRLTQSDLSHQAECFESDWKMLHVVQVTEPLVRRAGALARDHQLRGYDSVQLAAAEKVFNELPAETNFSFMVFDKELQAAARSLGMTITD